jgi:hypothetical protein
MSSRGLENKGRVRPAFGVSRRNDAKALAKLRVVFRVACRALELE